MAYEIAYYSDQTPAERAEPWIVACRRAAADSRATCSASAEFEGALRNMRAGGYCLPAEIVRRVRAALAED